MQRNIRKNQNMKYNSYMRNVKHSRMKTKKLLRKNEEHNDIIQALKEEIASGSSLFWTEQAQRETSARLLCCRSFLGLSAVFLTLVLGKRRRLVTVFESWNHGKMEKIYRLTIHGNKNFMFSMTVKCDSFVSILHCITYMTACCKVRDWEGRDSMASCGTAFLKTRPKTLVDFILIYRQWT